MDESLDDNPELRFNVDAAEAADGLEGRDPSS